MPLAGSGINLSVGQTARERETMDWPCRPLPADWGGKSFKMLSQKTCTCGKLLLPLSLINLGTIKTFMFLLFL